MWYLHTTVFFFLKYQNFDLEYFHLYSNVFSIMKYFRSNTFGVQGPVLSVTSIRRRLILSPFLFSTGFNSGSIAALVFKKISLIWSFKTASSTACLEGVSWVTHKNRYEIHQKNIQAFLILNECWCFFNSQILLLGFVEKHSELF